MTSTIILALIVLLVPPANQKHNGEAFEVTRSRYAVIADAIAAEAGDDRSLAIFLLTVARYESTFARSVHSGKTRGDGRRSWGLFQIMCGRTGAARVPGTKYQAYQIVGVDKAATARATKAAAVHLRHHARRCKGQPLCVFSAYAGVSKTALKKGDTMKRIHQRVTTFRRLMADTAKKERVAAPVVP